MALHRLLPFGLTCAALFAQAPGKAPTQAPSQAPSQAPVEALDAVPAGAHAYLFARSPQLAQAKLQGLVQRLGQPALDPLSDLQTRFGLRRLPGDRRGLALVFTEGLEAPTPRPLLFLALREPKDLLEALKAKAGEEGLYTFSAGGGARALVLREGWAILGDRSQAGALRAAAKARGGLRTALGDLAPWLEAQDVSALLAPEGLFGVLHEIRKKVAGTRGGTPAAAGDPLAQAEPILGQIQREVRQIGARAELDEHGNLQVVLRAQLHPQGQWIRMAEGLPEMPDHGLQGLRGTDFFMALGGCLPPAWSAAFAGMSLPQLPLGPGQEDAALTRDEALARIQRQIKSTHAVMGAPPLGLRQYLVVEDVEGYFRELEAFFALPSGQATGLRPRRLRLGDTEALALMMQLPSEGPEAPAAPRDMALLAALRTGPNTITLQVGPEALTLPREDTAPLLRESPLIRPTAALLPERAHFYAFFDGRQVAGPQEHQLAAQEARLPEADRLQLPALPDNPPFPTFGMALAFTPGAWELHLAFPWETQLGLARQLPARTKALEARRAAVEKALAEHPQAEGAEEAEDPEETGAD